MTIYGRDRRRGRRGREAGQGIIELLLLLSLVAIVAIVSLSFLGTRATGLVDHVNRGMTTINGTDGGSGATDFSDRESDRTF